MYWFIVNLVLPIPILIKIPHIQLDLTNNSPNLLVKVQTNSTQEKVCTSSALNQWTTVRSERLYLDCIQEHNLLVITRQDNKISTQQESIPLIIGTQQIHNIHTRHLWNDKEREMLSLGIIYYNNNLQSYSSYILNNSLGKRGTILYTHILETTGTISWCFIHLYTTI